MNEGAIKSKEENSSLLLRRIVVPLLMVGFLVGEVLLLFIRLFKELKKRFLVIFRPSLLRDFDFFLFWPVPSIERTELSRIDEDESFNLAQTLLFKAWFLFITERYFFEGGSPPRMFIDFELGLERGFLFLLDL